ncbi:molybdopterin converting factor subunit 1 [Virgibacillus natechei]|uniref:molybdopterin converting factor subunit 1 n=1 Tax=Virgibacillus sp. CBA3643 TaxID=2942278 RepID=UPI0035A37F00
MITILLFAQLQEDIGQNQLELEMNQTTVTDLKASLKEKYNLTQLNSVMTAINEEYALNDDMIQPGDTVAFIPPVSGG